MHSYNSVKNLFVFIFSLFFLWVVFWNPGLTQSARELVAFEDINMNLDIVNIQSWDTSSIEGRKLWILCQNNINLDN